MSEQWEYKILDYKESMWSMKMAVKVESLEHQLNELGRIGWELVSAVPNQYQVGVVLMLKRKR